MNQGLKNGKRIDPIALESKHLTSPPPRVEACTTGILTGGVPHTDTQVEPSGLEAASHHARKHSRTSVQLAGFCSPSLFNVCESLCIFKDVC